MASSAWTKSLKEKKLIVTSKGSMTQTILFYLICLIGFPPEIIWTWLPGDVQRVHDFKRKVGQIFCDTKYSFVTQNTQYLNQLLRKNNKNARIRLGVGH